MNKFRSGLVLLFIIILAGCGGSNDVPGKPKFAAQVSFGDSLSDVGTYQVGTVAALGGGQFTINAASSVKATTPTNWTEFTSLSLGLGMPCAAMTGLDGSAGQGFSVMPPVVHAGCDGYAQGGARVTNPIGVGNKLTGGASAILGMLTIPVVTQIQNYLSANGGSFKGNEIVYVMAGANDVFFQAGSITGSYPPASAVQAVQAAATDLANDVKTLIIGKGAKYVAVVNVPDIGSTPYGVSLGSNVALIDTLVTAFNAQLKASLPDSANVLNVDAFTASHDEVANPGKYLLTNVTDTACNLNTPPNALGSSLVCNSGNLNTGVTASDHYLFADTVHPTPYGHLLFATYMLQAMTNKGWY